MKKTFRIHALPFLAGLLLLFPSCKQEDPKPEKIPELISKATLTFTPAGGPPVVVTATDPDNAGVQDIIVDGAITLVKGTSYTLTILLVNGLYSTTQDGYDVSKQVEKEGTEHQFFFSWNAGLFSNPAGDGNIDNRNNPLNYGSSIDSNGRPLGLTTTWTTAMTALTGSNSFRILLKHQPDIKSDTSTSNDGESDLDLTFSISVN